MAWTVTDKEIAEIVATLTTEEKVRLLNGRHLWRTAINYRANIPEIITTDGTHGVRYSTDQIDKSEEDLDALEQFVDIVNRRQDDSAGLIGGGTKPTTCFPTGSAFGCSWNVELAYAFGTALAAECQEFGVHLLLGPGVNIRRTPLAGRSYEYYSEDPVVMSDLAAGVIRGLQEHGVGASLKHFACNNSEIERTTMSSDVDERALREIYLKGFERAIAKSDPWTVMTGYNRLNGIQAAEHPWLLTQVLRKEWGYKGLVISDWHGIKDRAASLLAGNDLDMPESAERRQELLDAIDEGKVETEFLDVSCSRMLRFLRKAKEAEKPDACFDREEHHVLARTIAAESIVLLRNEAALLPLAPAVASRWLVVGRGATAPLIQGSGSATIRPTFLDIPLDEIRGRAGADVEVEHAAAFSKDPLEAGREAERARILAENADAVIIFANSDITADGERADRRSLSLEAGQDGLIKTLAGINARTIVVLMTPDAVVMPWHDDVAAIIATFYAGQGMGAALARILLGEVNPSGKLTTSFPRREEDIPGFLTYPGENGRHAYSEGLFVGYRCYDKRKIKPLFPFGFGLSYTEFRYSDLKLSARVVKPGDELVATFVVTNTGERAGSEVAQLYVAWEAARLHRPIRELKGFAKVALAAHQSKTVSITVDVNDLHYYDPAHGAWLLDPSTFTVEIAASSRDIRLTQRVQPRPARIVHQPFKLDTQPSVIIADPANRDALTKYLGARLNISATAAERLVEKTENGFLGIHKTICWYIGERLPGEELQTFLDSLTNGPHESGGINQSVAD